VTLADLFSKINPKDIPLTTLLTGMGVSGVISTAYLTGRASFQASRAIEREDRKRRESLSGINPDSDIELMTTKEKIKLVWPLYIPPATVGATTISAIIMANHTASREQGNSDP
jgi:hypothetical protein